MIMIVRADQSRCMGHARCNVFAPDLFPLDDNGYIDVTEVHVDAAQEETARNAIAACPERVLTLHEDA